MDPSSLFGGAEVYDDIPGDLGSQAAQEILMLQPHCFTPLAGSSIERIDAAEENYPVYNAGGNKHSGVGIGFDHVDRGGGGNSEGNNDGARGVRVAAGHSSACCGRSNPSSGSVGDIGGGISVVQHNRVFSRCYVYHVCSNVYTIFGQTSFVRRLFITQC